VKQSTRDRQWSLRKRISRRPIVQDRSPTQKKGEALWVVTRAIFLEAVPENIVPQRLMEMLTHWVSDARRTGACQPQLLWIMRYLHRLVDCHNVYEDLNTNASMRDQF